MCYLALFLFSFLFGEQLDSVMLSGVDVVASIKYGDDIEKGAYSSTSVGRVEIENRHISSVKELTAIAPNFYQPDYGSRMTSSIYVRGFGSRIDQPVVGLTVDEVPVMNKNNYDAELFDISNVQIVRGAQSTMLGRNTVGGNISIHTLSPLVFQGKRLSVEYGNENSLRVKASHYASKNNKFGWSANVFYSHSDGFFFNEARNSNCDGGDNVAVRLRTQYLSSSRLSVDNTMVIGYVDEGGWAYGLYDDAAQMLNPVAYNDACSYRRFNVNEGLVIKRFFDDFTFSSSTAYQYMHDRMRIDNDFLPFDYFSMGQYQKEHSFSQEFVAKSLEEKRLGWMAGANIFYKDMDMDAPVLFKQYGIDKLILSNMNGMLHGTGYNFGFRDSSFPIEDKFKIPTYGVAVYGEVGYEIGYFDIRGGLRLDYERATMDYNSYAAVSYKSKKEYTNYRTVNSSFVGNASVEAIEVLPRFSVMYKREWGNIYASVSKGLKAGGFNTQLFSDILRDKLAKDLWNDFQGTPSDYNSDASVTEYDPELTWNYELGTHLSPFSDGRMQFSASLFYIDCANQQITVFPKGLSTGRMMSNAGKSHSYGAELSLKYIYGNVTLDAAYGYAHAVFDEYKSGKDDYAGKYIPLAPRETMSANVAYSIPAPRSFANYLILNVGWNGVGRIYWNEENSLSQAFYAIWNASLSWEKGHYGVSLWGKNLLNEDFKTFYFKSIGNNFFAKGKPLQFGVSLHLNL